MNKKRKIQFVALALLIAVLAAPAVLLLVGIAELVKHVVLAPHGFSFRVLFK